MNLEQLATNRALQEQFVDGADDQLIKSKIYEVLDFANSCAAELSSNYSQQLEETQNLSLRCCFFFLNQLGDRRLKQSDFLPEGEREEDFQKVKEDFELILRFAKTPEDMDPYFFKSGKERIFQVAVFAALSFMGGNPAIERVESGAEEMRLKCFEVLMHALDRAR